MELVTESMIEGACEGFDGGRVFELVNGQRWQQAVYRYRYCYRYRPAAKIWRGGSQHLIEIQGMGEMIQVTRV